MKKNYCLLLLSCSILLAACTTSELVISQPKPAPEDTRSGTAFVQFSPTPEISRVPATGVTQAAGPGESSTPTTASDQADTPIGLESATSMPPTVTPRPTLAPEAWQSLPVIPALSDTAKAIYQRGLAMGRNPQVFSKVGDCQNITTYFLAHFEDPSLYRLGDYLSLQDTIDWFKGSFGRESLSVKGGLNVAAALSPLRADPKICAKGESPIACEYRMNNPSLAIISMEEAWSGDAEKYGKYMRQVIEFTIEQGIVPIIATKADDLEGGNQINAIIAQLAWEYDIPLWNFWAAVQPLRYHGLSEDGFHLTHGNNFAFDVPLSGMTGWTIRNLTALQVLDAARKGLNSK